VNLVRSFVDNSLMAASKLGKHENQKKSPVIANSVFADPESLFFNRLLDTGSSPV
jgi:hypothetical protein